MNRKLTIIFLSFFLILFSCTKSNNALKFNNRIIKLQSDVVEKMLSLANSFRSSNPSIMKKKLAELQKETSIAADKLNEIPNFKGGEDLFNAAMDLFEFYESVSKNEFAEMVEILSKGKGGITKYDIDRLKDIQKAITIDETKLDMKFQRAQRNFASKYKLRIKPNKLQKRINNLN